MLDAGLVWFRRDLRADDHAALAAALAACRRVHCVFVYDRAILDELNVADRRVDFIHRSLAELDDALRARGGGIIAVHGQPIDAIPPLAQELRVDAVFANRDYEPYARARDQQLEHRLAADSRRFLTFKDQVIFERSEILTGAGRPYAVFTAYANAWRRLLAAPDTAEHETSGRGGQLAAPSSQKLPTLAELGFRGSDLASVPLSAGRRRGERYFARQLNDYDLAANNGGWQWSASTGCDAQPYFRIFNPVAQSERFDAAGVYIRRWLPELNRFTDREIHAPWRLDLARQRAVGCVIGTDYPAPIVDHARARAAALARYAMARQQVRPTRARPGTA